MSAYLDAPTGRFTLPPSRTTGYDYVANQRLGAYKLIAGLGSSPNSEVWYAQDRITKQMVALKCIKPSLAGLTVESDEVHPFTIAKLLQRNESRILGKLDHPGIIRPHAYDPSFHFLVLEPLGGNLLSCLDLGTRMSWGILGPYLLQVATTLTELLPLGFRHYDIKPHNILLVPGDPNRIKLVDCGTSRLTGVTPPKLPGYASVSPLYAAPEQLGQNKHVNERADVYGLGVTAYALATGTLPHHDDSPIRVVNATLNDTPIKPNALVADLPPGVSKFIRRCMIKSPRRRPPIEQVVTDLTRLI